LEDIHNAPLSPKTRRNRRKWFYSVRVIPFCKVASGLHQAGITHQGVSKMALITFHKIISGCEDGRRDCWQLFLTQYSPTARQLSAVYLPALAGSWNGFWDSVLQSLAAEDCKQLRSFDHQGEREFLLDLRGFLLERGAQELDSSHDSGEALSPAPESIAAMMHGLPLAHQSILFLKLAGYSDATIEKIYTITPAIAQHSLERLQPEYSSFLGQQQDVCRWPAAWLKLLLYLRASRGESCVTPRLLVRMLDGQINWYEKEPVESHMSGCLSCLETWTALREVVYWRREAKPWPTEYVQAALSALSLGPEVEQRRSLFKRVFSPSR
jgi:hypothetical protein